MPYKEIYIDCDTHWKYFFVALPGSTFYCDTPLQSFLIALLSDSLILILPDSTFVCYTRWQFV